MIKLGLVHLASKLGLVHLASSQTNKESPCYTDTNCQHFWAQLYTMEKKSFINSHNQLKLLVDINETHSSDDVDDGCHVGLALVVGAGLLGHQRPQLLHVDCGAVGLLGGLVEVTHAHLTEVTRMAANNISYINTGKTGSSTRMHSSLNAIL